jgi:hypothetical protein
MRPSEALTCQERPDPKLAFCSSTGVKLIKGSPSFTGWEMDMLKSRKFPAATLPRRFIHWRFESGC